MGLYRVLKLESALSFSGGFLTRTKMGKQEESWELGDRNMGAVF